MENLVRLKELFGELHELLKEDVLHFYFEINLNSYTLVGSIALLTGILLWIVI